MDPHSGVPTYVQVMDQVRHAIQIGGLRSGEQLPTVGRMAAELTVAPNTIVSHSQLPWASSRICTWTTDIEVGRCSP